MLNAQKENKNVYQEVWNNEGKQDSLRTDFSFVSKQELLQSSEQLHQKTVCQGRFTETWQYLNAPPNHALVFDKKMTVKMPLITTQISFLFRITLNIRNLQVTGELPFLSNLSTLPFPWYSVPVSTAMRASFFSDTTTLYW